MKASFENWADWNQQSIESGMWEDDYLAWVSICALATKNPDSCFIAVEKLGEDDSIVFQPIGLRVDNQELLPVNRTKQTYIWVTEMGRFKNLAKQFIKGELDVVEPVGFGEVGGDMVIDLFHDNLRELAGRIQARKIPDDAIHPRIGKRY